MFATAVVLFLVTCVFAFLADQCSYGSWIYKFCCYAVLVSFFGSCAMFLASFIVFGWRYLP